MDELILIKKSELTSIIETSLKRVLKNTQEPQPNQENDTLNIHEVSLFSGYKVNTLYRLVHDKKIPYHKPKHGGRKLIFYKEEIQDWLKGKKPETTEEYCERMSDELSKSRR